MFIHLADKYGKHSVTQVPLWSLVLASPIIASRPRFTWSLTSRETINEDDLKAEKLYSKPASIIPCVPLCISAIPWRLVSTARLNTWCGGIYSLISLFWIASSSTPLFLVFWDELRYHLSTAVWSAYTIIQGGLMWWSVLLGYRIKMDTP